MWYSSLNGIHEKSHNNFNTACIGGVLLSMHKKVCNLRSTTTEPFEHIFGTACSWRRKFTVNEFIIYANKLETIIKHVIKNGINTAILRKGLLEFQVCTGKNMSVIE